MRLKIGFIVASTFLSTSGYSQPDLDPEVRNAIYRIEQPGAKLGTAILLSHGVYGFAITNTHVVRDASSKICDSVFLYLNQIQDNKEVISGTERRTVYLRSESDTFYFECSAQQLDLVFISLSTRNSTFGPDDVTHKMSTSTIPNQRELSSLLRSGSIVTYIGYPSKRVSPLVVTASPEYRWGYCLKYDSVYITTNAPLVAGSSGSLGLVAAGGKYYFVGIATKIVNGNSVAITSPSITSCYSRIFKLMDGNED